MFKHNIIVQNSTYQNLRRQTGIDDNDEEMAVVLRDWLGWIFRDLPFNHIVSDGGF
jgi:hypothetical protein